MPLGVLLLSGFALVSVGILGLSAFGPPLPGPDVSKLFRDPQGPRPPCDPRSARVREPRQPVAAPGQWRAEPRIPGAYDEVRGVALDGRAYVLSGQDLAKSVARVQTYDPSRTAYSDAPMLPVALDHTAAVTYRGAIYVVGGDADGRSTDGLWRYSPQERVWTELTSMEMPRAAHAAEVIGDRLYVMGGTSQTDFTNFAESPTGSLEIYDFRTDTWTRGPDMLTARHHFDAGAVDGQLYAIGGRTPGEFSLDTVERFDPDSGEWETLPPLPQGHRRRKRRGRRRAGRGDRRRRRPRALGHTGHMGAGPPAARGGEGLRTCACPATGTRPPC